MPTTSLRALSNFHILRRPCISNYPVHFLLKLIDVAQFQSGSKMYYRSSPGQDT